MINVFYYYYYLFYTKIIVQPNPHLVTTLVLSFLESLLLNGIIDFIAVIRYCYIIGRWPMMIITVLIIISNYLFYHKSGRALKIIKEKPLFFNNHKLTIVIIILFSLLVSSWLFWGSTQTRNILENCI